MIDDRYLNDPEDKPTKTESKREMLALQKLGEWLPTLTAKQLATLDLPEGLLDAIKECKNIPEHRAMRRQYQFIGRLMRLLDEETVKRIKQSFSKLGN